MAKQGQASHVANADYDASKNTLTVTFDNKAVYEYYGVPESLYTAWASEGFSGSFLHTNIKGKFRYSRV